MKAGFAEYILPAPKTDRSGDELNTIIEELNVCLSACIAQADAKKSEAGRNVYLCGVAEARGRQEALAA